MERILHHLMSTSGPPQGHLEGHSNVLGEVAHDSGQNYPNIGKCNIKEANGIVSVLKEIFI